VLGFQDGRIYVLSDLIIHLLAHSHPEHRALNPAPHPLVPDIRNPTPFPRTISMNTTQDIRERFIAAAGDLTQSLGFGRNLGQIYGHIYFSPAPQSLDDLCESLGISKGSASMSVRQLEQWGALKKIWVKGTRKDYYEAGEEFGRIIRKALIDMVGRTTESADDLIRESEAWLKTNRKNGSSDREDLVFLAGRVKKLQDFRKRAAWLWNSPMIKLLLKK